jgi:putative effector of murein hydrolase
VIKDNELTDQLSLDFYNLNTLPTYENMVQVYQELRLPSLNPELIAHKKEQMIFMIINMLRTQPQIYMHAMSILQDRCN